MTTLNFTKTTRIAAPVEAAFAWHERPGAFERLAPPWENVRVVSAKGTIHDGDEKVVQVRVGPLRQTFHARHYGYEKDRQFCDEQVRGPFAAWHQVHRFQAEGPNGCRIEDQVEYRLPFGPLGRAAPRCMVQGRLESMFAYRSTTARNDIERHHASGLEPMRVLLTGAGGLVGSALTAFLESGGHTVVALTRSGPFNSAHITWNPLKGFAANELGPLEGFDAVIHLAGEPILGYWSEAKKKRIMESRVIGTRNLCEALAKLDSPPKVLLSASAVGVYGNRGDEELTEESPPGEGFLPRVGREWEAAAGPARETGIRTVHMRLGPVFSPRGGALGTMRLPFSLGIGGRIGRGGQYMPWIGVDDVLYAALHCLADEAISGPVNFTAPEPVTNRELTRTLARVLRRPVGPPAPEFVLRPLLRDMAEEFFLASTRAVPRRLEESGFRFAHPALEGALRHLLGREKQAE